MYSDQYLDLASDYARKIADWYTSEGADGSDKSDTNDGTVKKLMRVRSADYSDLR